MNKTITITISGECASGKTTLAQFIAHVLRDVGFGVHVDDVDLNNNPPGNFQERLKAVSTSLVDIKTIQTRGK